MFEGVVIKDSDGNIRDENWLQERYGAITLRPAHPGDGYRLVGLQENKGAAVLQMKVLDEDGAPSDTVMSARRWPYRQYNPDYEDDKFILPSLLATWFARGVWGWTKEDGVVGFGTGGGDVYWPGPPDFGIGASTLWVEGHSDAVEGLGILQEPNYPHMEPIFRFDKSGPPPPDPVKKLIESAQVHLDLSKEHNALAQEDLDKALALLP